MAMITIHAPSANLVAITITVTSPVTAAPTPLSVAFSLHRASRAEPVPHHPGLREREGSEHADHVQVDRELTLARKATISAVEKPARMRIPFE